MLVETIAAGSTAILLSETIVHPARICVPASMSQHETDRRGRNVNTLEAFEGAPIETACPFGQSLVIFIWAGLPLVSANARTFVKCNAVEIHLQQPRPLLSAPETSNCPEASILELLMTKGGIIQQR